MKILLLFVAIGLVLITSQLAVNKPKYTEDEQLLDEGKDFKRNTKKTINRLEEAFCRDGDLSCAMQKGENRLEETKESIKDTKEEIKHRSDK